MKFEYNIWNITKGWQLMKATTLEAATREINAMGPYGEEAKIRDETGQIYERKRRD